MPDMVLGIDRRVHILYDDAAVIAHRCPGARILVGERDLLIGS
jgi:hypothetical protein